MKQNNTTPTSKMQDKATAEILKIGIDIHKCKYVVVCQEDGEGPKAPQSFSPEAFFAWAVKRFKQAGKTYCRYEAGCFGYAPHRRLEALGATNFVVRPRNWDEYGSEGQDRRSRRQGAVQLSGSLSGRKRTSEASSGGKRQQGSVNKNGNPRIRHVLIESVWRMFHFQPEYKAIAKWKERMRTEPFGPARKKKMAVAIAREFAVDWWRIQTGSAKPEEIGLRMGYPASYAAKAM